MKWNLSLSIAILMVIITIFTSGTSSNRIPDNNFFLAYKKDCDPRTDERHCDFNSYKIYCGQHLKDSLDALCTVKGIIATKYAYDEANKVCCPVGCKTQQLQQFCFVKPNNN